MKVLAIGNSFSQNAMKYLHRIAQSTGTDLKTVNLYIGGCPLRTHYLNMQEDAYAYDFQFNGVSTGVKVSIKQALISDEWDVITFQQASPNSPFYKTYQPYLNELAAYVRKYCPHAKFLIHQTWAYAEYSERMHKMGFENSAAMFADVEASYSKAAEAIGAKGIIPAGRAMLRAVQNGIADIHSDGHHASAGAGCYLLGLVWYGYLTGKPVKDVSFCDFAVPVSDEEIAIAKKTAAEVLGQEA